MILTYKIKHNKDFSAELIKAKQIAGWAIQNRDKLSSKYVKHFGLKAIIANQILRKYGRNKKCKTIHKINLIIPNQGIKIKNSNIFIPSLKLTIFIPQKSFIKIRQIEIDNVYTYISCEVETQQGIMPKTTMGVDLNATGHCAVVAIKNKVYKLGKSIEYIHKKYKDIRKKLQAKSKYKKVKKIKQRESNKVKDINHKIAKFIVQKAIVENAEIKLEKLTNIRERTNKKNKYNKKSRYSVNSWGFSQLKSFIEYKALLAGISVVYVDPYNTSKKCSKCGLIGERIGKLFKCPHCGHVDHADVNAAFNIANTPLSIGRLFAEWDVNKGSTDTPKEATFRKLKTLEPCLL